MLNKNIKTLRKTKGLSLQELVVKLDVVRQTISKWDQELSVPDSDMLISIAEALETPVSTLLGETITEDSFTARGSAHTYIPEISPSPFHLPPLMPLQNPLPSGCLIRSENTPQPTNAALFS